MKRHAPTPTTEPKSNVLGARRVTDQPTLDVEELVTKTAQLPREPTELPIEPSPTRSNALVTEIRNNTNSCGWNSLVGCGTSFTTRSPTR